MEFALAAAAVIEIEAAKKADVTEHTEVLDHIGLLVNGTPGRAGLPFKSSSDVFALDRDRGLDAGYALATTTSIIPRWRGLANGNGSFAEFAAHLRVVCASGRPVSALHN
jgi:hypothetical protein